MSTEHEAADQIRRMLTDDERFKDVSGATAFRRADPKEGWSDAGFFSFERDGRLYFVTVDLAETAPEVEEDEEWGPMTTEEKAQAEAASWKRWQSEWGNTESGAHAYGWQEGYKAGQAEVERLRAENERLTEIVKEAWRLWADLTDGFPIALDRGYQVVRIHPKRYAAFDALFRARTAP